MINKNTALIISVAATLISTPQISHMKPEKRVKSESQNNTTAIIPVFVLILPPHRVHQECKDIHLPNAQPLLYY